MRILLPLIFLILALVWFLIELVVRKNKKQAGSIAALTFFFSIAWMAMYFFIFN